MVIKTIILQYNSQYRCRYKSNQHAFCVGDQSRACQACLGVFCASVSEQSLESIAAVVSSMTLKSTVSKGQMESLKYGVGHKQDRSLISGLLPFRKHKSTNYKH